MDDGERRDLTPEVRLEVVAHDDPDAVEGVARYLAELDARFPAGFDPGPPLPLDVFVVARIAGHDGPVGCGGLQTLAPGVAEIKRMWVDPATRGHGLGRRLLARLEQLAVDGGHTVVRLDTNGTLTEAIAMYERAGYRRIERYNDNPYAELFFERDLPTPTTRA